MLAPLPEILESARAARGAIAAFTAYNGETAVGVVRAAEERGVPTILLLSAGSLRSPNGRLLLPLVRAVAERAEVPVCIQLDHVSERELIEAALEGGVGAVMADGSRLMYNDNVAFVRAAVKAAARHGAHIEAELGHIPGEEDATSAPGVGALTDPSEAAEFVRTTGAACLAVSIGNVHGTYSSTPILDFDRLQLIRAEVDIPLSLHGASGLQEADIRRAVRRGICKINVNTELRACFFRALDQFLPQTRSTLNLLVLDSALIDTIKEAASVKLDLLSSEPANEPP